MRRADGGAGVVVLADLGSAVLTVRAMLGDLPDVTVAAGGRAVRRGRGRGDGDRRRAAADLTAVAKAAEEAWHARKL